MIVTKTEYTPGFVRNTETNTKTVYKILQISDSTSLVFDLWVPESIIPDNLSIGDVVRVKSCIAGPLTSKKSVLVASETTNLLVVPSNFKLYHMFHSKIENTEFNLSNAILGGFNQNKPSSA